MKITIDHHQNGLIGREAYPEEFENLKERFPDFDSYYLLGMWIEDPQIFNMGYDEITDYLRALLRFK